MKRTIFSLGVVVLTGMSILIAREATSREAKGGPAPKLNVQDTPLVREAHGVTSYAPIIKRVAPSVVTIYSTKTVKVNPQMFENPFFRFFGGGDDSDDNFGNGNGNGNGNGRSRKRTEQGLGSGVVVTRDGYIVTNNHVVEGADEVEVSLANGADKFTAKVIGTDPQTDVAVIKVDTKDLPAIAFTDSDKVEVGDVVLAIGNPFGVGQTVTSGIVSAMGRGGLGITDYEDFIQTDASINPGNSGGALIDAEGRLIGINTAIFSRSGGNQGIGFAIPSNLVRMVMERITRDGKFTRGMLGVMIQPVTPELAKEFKLPDASGALVGEVSPGGPAARAGIKNGDVITEFNGRKVTDSQHLRLVVAQTAPNTKVTVKAVRDGKEKTFTATLDELVAKDAEGGRGRKPGKIEPDQDLLDGVEVTDLDNRTRRQMSVPTGVRGALATAVEQGSPSETAGLQAGDVIQEINHAAVANADDAVELSKKPSKTDHVLLHVWSRSGGSHYVIVDTRRSRK